MKGLFFMFLFFGGYGVFAQNITVVEYFFDSDPGYGSGISVAITPAVTITNFTFPINIAAQSDGFHTLFVRAKDANNNWSAAYSRPFYKLSAAVVTPTTPNINKIEYFFDTDPGYGAGTNVPITPATSITDLAFALPLGSAADGFHTLFIRTRDANNNWSAAYSRPFYKLSSSALPSIPNLNKLEYFIDADPGYGAGVNVPITAGVAVNDLIAAIPVTAIAEGNHIISFRARDVNNNWSVVAIKSFSKCNHPGTAISAATTITSTSFIASWADVPGSISYRLDVSTDNFNTFVSGYNAKVITAPALTSTVTGLAQATTYQYRVRAVASCTSVESNTIAVKTLATPPTAQPTNLLFSSVTSSGYTAFFTAPATAPSGYLVVRKVASSPTFVPVNNTTYTAGQTVGDGVVAYVGTSFLFNESGLTPNTRYYYDVFAFNTNNGSTSYLTTTPLEGSVITTAIEPSAQPTNLQFTSVTDIGYSVNFTAATGNADGYLVLRKVGSAPASVPVDGTVYTTTVGTDAVVYNGAATNFLQSGLTQNTEYFYTVFAYNGSSTAINYRTVSPLQGSQLTPITPPSASPTNLVFSNVTSTGMNISYTAAPGSPAGYLVVRKVGSNPNFIPQVNATYTLGQVLSDGVVAYVGSALTFNETSLVASTTYFYDVFAYNQNGSLIGYQTNAPLEGSKTTFTAEPTAQASGVMFPNPVTTTSITVTFTAASPAAAGYLVLRKAGAAPTVTPVDGSAYTLAQTLGDAAVAFVGASTNFVDSGLQPGTTYFYQVFSYNGSGAATNYLTTVTASNSGSKITVPDKPVLQLASSIGQNQFTANWTATTGATNYRLDVSKDNFVTRVSGFDNLTVNSTTQLISGLETGTAYKYRVRAVNTSGTSVNSDEAQQFTIPATPVLSAASIITQTSFTANWNLVTGATGYLMDVSLANDFSSFVTSYQSKSLTSIASESVGGLESGKTYFYRIRSTNTGGTSPNSTALSQLLIPPNPVGIDATGQQSNSFKAKWQPATGAAEYRLDVTLASNDFNPSLPNFTNKLVTATEETVDNLTASTSYKYRIRAVNASGTSFNSNVVSVSTTAPPTGSVLQLSNLSAPTSFSGTTVNTSVEVSGGTPGYTVNFFYRKITASDFTVRPLSSTSNTFQTQIDASLLDELGLEYYFEVTDAIDSKKATVKNYLYYAIPAAGLKIPFTKSGGTAQSYEIFSIPYQLTDNLIASIFEELGAYEKPQWRLVRYQGDKNVDFGSGINRIELGKGYWFNRKENIEISFSNGTVANVNQATDGIIPLEKGWNQIGNPLPFNVDWDDILNANASSNLIGKLKVFNPTGLHLNDESNNLKTWSGGFVFNGNERVDLKVPVTLKNTAGGRKDSRVITNGELDKAEWYVPIIITQGEEVRTVAGVGMHPNASASFDGFDDVIVPRFLNYLELYSTHTDFFSPKFSRDIVPAQAGFTWDFAFESNSEAGNTTLQWDNQNFGVNDAELLLFDQSHNVLINMKSLNGYSFTPAQDQQFKILYGSNRKELKPDLISLSSYPNPFKNGSTTAITFITKAPESMVSISVIDLMGKPVKQLVQGVYAPGIYETVWEGKNGAGDEVAQGLYLLQMEVDGKVFVSRVIKN